VIIVFPESLVFELSLFWGREKSSRRPAAYNKHLGSSVYPCLGGREAGEKQNKKDSSRFLYWHPLAANTSGITLSPLHNHLYTITFTQSPLHKVRWRLLPGAKVISGERRQA
jgi:hypothetical protein